MSEQEKKEQALTCLKAALDFARPDVDCLTLTDNDTVTIRYRNGYTKQVNIACDSIQTMLEDVLAKV